MDKINIAADDCIIIYVRLSPVVAGCRRLSQAVADCHLSGIQMNRITAKDFLARGMRMSTYSLYVKVIAKQLEA